MNEYKHQPQTPTVLKVEKTINSTIISGLPAGTVIVRDNPGFDKPVAKTEPCRGHDAFSFTEEQKKESWPSKDNIVRFAHKLLTDEMEKMGIPWIAGYTNEEGVSKAYDEFFCLL